MNDSGANANPPPGWYPDPEMAATQRYWDGATWTDHRAPGSPQAPVAATKRRGPRKMTWALIAWSVLILVWAIAGGGDANSECRADAVTQLERDACDAGTGIGVAIVLVIGFCGFVVLSLIWFMTRPREG